jgi:phosphocarrier protein
MKSFEFVVKDECGIHARPAGLLANKAKSFDSDIEMKKGANTANMKKLFSLMSLGVKKNDKVIVNAQGADEDKAIQDIQDFFNKNL